MYFLWRGNFYGFIRSSSSRKFFEKFVYPSIKIYLLQMMCTSCYPYVTWMLESCLWPWTYWLRFFERKEVQWSHIYDVQVLCILSLKFCAIGIWYRKYLTLLCISKALRYSVLRKTGASFYFIFYEEAERILRNCF